MLRNRVSYIRQVGIKQVRSNPSVINGFTILEMLIVLSIISLIFTLTLPNIQTRLATIRTKGCESLVDVINSNIIQYELEHGEIPMSLEDLLDAGLIKEQQMKCPNGDDIHIVDGQATTQ